MRLPAGASRREPRPPLTLVPDEPPAPQQHLRPDALRPQRMLSSIGWLLVAQLSAGAGQFGLSVLLARHLGAEVFGKWAFAFAFVALFSVLADFGFSTLAVRDLARDPRIAGKYVGNVLVLKTALAAVALTAMLAIEPLVRHDATVWLLVLLLGSQMLLMSATQLLFSVFRAHQRMQFEAGVRAVHAASLLGVAGVLVMAGSGITAFAWGVLAVAGASSALTVWLVITDFAPISLRVDLSFCRSLLREAWPIGLAIACTSVYYYADTIMLGVFSSTREVGLYGAAYLPILGLTLFIGAIRNAYFPAQSQARADPAGLARLLRQYGRLTALLALPVAVGGALLAQPLLVVLYGREYGEAATALRLLFLTGGVMLFSSYFGSELLAGNRQRRYLIGAGIGAGANLVLNAVLIPMLGMEGAAAATLASESAVCAYMWFQRQRDIRIGDLVRGASLAAVPMALVLLAGVRVAPVYATALAGAAAYLVAYYLLAGDAFRRELPALLRLDSVR